MAMEVRRWAGRSSDLRETTHTFLQSGFKPRAEGLRSACSSRFDFLTITNIRRPIRDTSLDLGDIKGAVAKLGLSFRTGKKVSMEGSTLVLPVPSQLALGLLFQRAPELLDRAKEFVDACLKQGEAPYSLDPKQIAAGFLVMHILCNGLDGIYGELDIRPGHLLLLGDKAPDVIYELLNEHLRLVTASLEVL